ncbi:UDP-N-acetylgalactosamine-undecaprenyl-phosphate N-acetylgalactosaminephosphotransferase [Gemmata sp. SH-PL17]|uniref:sugar transferase n=1 Tax=Gemmata sp. SH-PL17 TaxID=1630693 RepID=UPI0004B8CE15|nr:sugar transferase [Gemmata sp. SH-PL17]AMV23492.1 UDP-N-acetylgalactosamine-undecaprenyl-phosphate N-acetylgalactosaminephosphotransferase [Gemmata sp. SH-PL17]
MSAVPTHPPTLPTPAQSPEREPWPEIDCLPSDAVLEIPVNLGWYAAAKIVFDYAAALAMLPLALVLMAFAAIAVKITSPGPVFYTQTRVGLNGRKYKIIKIRSMRLNCEASSGIQWSQKGDTRITAVGKFLRATHIDELPQLFNVLLGHMSLVGPRPERPEVIQAKGLNQLVPGYRHRLRVKPGVTGLAQCQLPADSDVTSVRYKVVYDLYYVENQSLFLDLRLIAATLCKAGASPNALRRLFFLPNRDAVAAGFVANVVSIPDDSETMPALMPA